MSCLLLSAHKLLFSKILDPRPTIYYGHSKSLIDRVHRGPHGVVERSFIRSALYIVPIHLTYSSRYALPSSLAGILCRQFHSKMITRPLAAKNVKTS